MHETVSVRISSQYSRCHVGKGVCERVKRVAVCEVVCLLQQTGAQGSAAQYAPHVTQALYQSSARHQCLVTTLLLL